jgi:hypothetical protein
VNTRGGKTVYAKPGVQLEMRCGVFWEAYGGGHINDSIDQLGLLDLWVGFIAPLELKARQAVASMQRRWLSRQLGFGMRLYVGALACHRPIPLELWGRIGME